MPDDDIRAVSKRLRYAAPVLLLVAAVAAGGFFFWWRYYAFTDQFYEPLQPIPYSHQLHAGVYRIPCQYCHFNAQRGKHAGAPPMSVCLGCHDTSKGNIATNRPAVQRLLEFADTDREGYTDQRDWDLRDDGAIKEGNVVHWNRVHLLPDHVYFSHEWHVKAGVSCQTCHGPVEDMAVVAQFEDLSMGWCIRCHRDEQYTSLATQRSGLHDRYDGSAESFRVGTANYDVLRARVRPDSQVPFAQRELAGGDHDHQHAHDGHAPAMRDPEQVDHAKIPEHRTTQLTANPSIGPALRGTFDEDLDSVVGEDVGWFTAAQGAALQKLFDTYPKLPRWRVADLPESHQVFYGTEMLQNAPTQCSTCHQ